MQAKRSGERWRRNVSLLMTLRFFAEARTLKNFIADACRMQITAALVNLARRKVLIGIPTHCMWIQDKMEIIKLSLMSENVKMATK